MRQTMTSREKHRHQRAPSVLKTMTAKVDELGVIMSGVKSRAFNVQLNTLADSVARVIADREVNSIRGVK